jgi:hypothetical protein
MTPATPSDTENCPHPDFTKERIRGAQTGDPICKVCGQTFTPAEYRELMAGRVVRPVPAACSHVFSKEKTPAGWTGDYVCSKCREVLTSSEYKEYLEGRSS